MEIPEGQDRICRLCDQKSKKTYSLIDHTQDGQEILQLIKDFLPGTVFPNDPLSKTICDTCYETLNSYSKFRSLVRSTAKKQNNDLSPSDAELMESCQRAEKEEKPATRSTQSQSTTTDFPILCLNCKQTIVEANACGDLDVCSDLHQIFAEMQKRNKLQEPFVEKVLRSRKKKPQPFYHELEDSLCSSLTEFTNTESSQCYENDCSTENDSMESDSDQRPHKRRKLDNGQESIENGQMEVFSIEDKKKQSLLDSLREDLEYRYDPVSLLQLTLNQINSKNIPGYQADGSKKSIAQKTCHYCHEKFDNSKLLSLHEIKHIYVEIGEKIDNPCRWDEAREDAEVRNKWLDYFNEHGYEENHIIIENNDNLLIPINMEEYDNLERELREGQRVFLKDEKAYVGGVLLNTYSKDERKEFYQTIRVGRVIKKYCHICRYAFKDNWSIEAHYFSRACHFTCKYCGMRFNKQRTRFDAHMVGHREAGDRVATTMFTASKLSNFLPRVIDPNKAKITIVEEDNPPIYPFTAEDDEETLLNSESPLNFEDNEDSKSRMQTRKSLPASIKVKEEIVDGQAVLSSKTKGGNQAYFCRKCYKVFFKLDEFNLHSKGCDYNQYSANKSSSKQPPPQPSVVNSKKNSFANTNGQKHSAAGRPMRNCVKEVGTYKDELYIPEALLNDKVAGTPNQPFVCFICNTPFPTIYSRNSHMRIHKYVGKTAVPNKPKTCTRAQQKPTRNSFPEVKVKQEPLEPMVEIHEEPKFTSIGDGAVSITPIVKNPNQKPHINPNIMKLVKNNPNLTIKKTVEKVEPTPTSSTVSKDIETNSSDGDKGYKCSSCSEAFLNKSHLYFHKKNKCVGSRFPCPFCKKRFGTEAAYSSHIFYSHPE